MSLYWIYDLPNTGLCLLTIAVFTGFSLIGLFASRPIVRRILRESPAHNDIVSFFFSGIGVFYGLALGLIAVGTWENYSGVDGLVSKEAAALAGLYRDFDVYPSPMRQKQEAALRDYTRQVIEKEWPAHRRGEAPEDVTLVLDAIENDLLTFEPTKESEKIGHAEVLHSLDEVVDLRRLRLQSVTGGLPAALWSVVIVGAWLTVALTYLFWVENVRLHAILVGLLATFIALLVFLTAAMDNPFRGEFSVSPDAFRAVLDNVMKPGAGATPNPPR
jgi:hypothetical protein